EVHLVGKAAFLRDLDDRHAGFLKEMTRAIDPAADDELVKRYPRALLENAAEMVGAEAKFVGDLRQRQALAKPRVDELADVAQLPLGEFPRRRGFRPLAGVVLDEVSRDRLDEKVHIGSGYVRIVERLAHGVAQLLEDGVECRGGKADRRGRAVIAKDRLRHLVKETAADVEMRRADDRIHGHVERMLVRYDDHAAGAAIKRMPASVDADPAPQ